MTGARRALTIAATEAERDDRTITHADARAIADIVGYVGLGFHAEEFIEYGVVPERYSDVMQMHAKLTFGVPNQLWCHALARYLRTRHQEDKVGRGHTWKTLTD